MKLPKTIEEVQEFLGCEDKYISHNNSSSITSISYDGLLQCFRAYEEKHKKKSKWIKWDGGDCPVPGNTIVDVKFKSGYKFRGYRACSWKWPGSGSGQIVAYKVIEGQNEN